MRSMNLDNPVSELRLDASLRDPAAQCAERQLAEYLRQWGLRDPSTIALHCRRWSQQALDQANEQASNSRSDEDLCQTAIVAAIDEVDAWLDRLAEQTCGPSQDAASHRGLIAMEAQRMLHDRPEIFLQTEPLPDDLAQRLRQAARPVVPPSHPTQMAPQPLGKLPFALRPKWWRRWAARLASSLGYARPRAWERAA